MATFSRKGKPHEGKCEVFYSLSFVSVEGKEANCFKLANTFNPEKFPQSYKYLSMNFVLLFGWVEIL